MNIELLSHILEIIDKTPDRNDPGLTLNDFLKWDDALIEIHDLIVSKIQKGGKYGTNS